MEGRSEEKKLFAKTKKERVPGGGWGAAQEAVKGVGGLGRGKPGGCRRACGVEGAGWGRGEAERGGGRGRRREVGW